MGALQPAAIGPTGSGVSLLAHAWVSALDARVLGVFESFTESARQVVSFAAEEATGLKHDFIGEEHALLGLLRERQGVAAQVLGSLDFTVDEVRVQVARTVGPGFEEPSG